MQGHTINIGYDNNSNNFGIGANSALLIKNGTIENTDTNNDDTSILILSEVTVTERVFLGNTQSWIVNNSSINMLYPEDGSVTKLQLI